MDKTPGLADVYEVHITVATDNISRFRSDCEHLGVKPIVLDLQNLRGDGIMTDVMTSGKYKGADPIKNGWALAAHLKSLGYQVHRIKVEATPWCSLVPTQINQLIVADSNYFESHVKIATRECSLPALRSVCKTAGAHLSRNVFSEAKEGVFILATLRKHEGFLEDFQANVASFITVLEEHGYGVVKAEVEFAIYDSNVNHDLSWISACE